MFQLNSICSYIGVLRRYVFFFLNGNADFNLSITPDSASLNTYLSINSSATGLNSPVVSSIQASACSRAVFAKYSVLYNSGFLFLNSLILFDIFTSNKPVFGFLVYLACDICSAPYKCSVSFKFLKSSILSLFIISKNASRSFSLEKRGYLLNASSFVK